MSLEELKKLGAKRIELAELPKEIIATVTACEFKVDKTGRKCLYVTLATPENASITQKYTPMHIPDLVYALEKLGYTSMKDLFSPHKWILKNYRIGMPRLIPIEKVK